MYLVYVIIGLIIGSTVAGGGRYAVLGAVSGAVIGLLLARLRKLEQRVDDLESVARKPSRLSISTPAVIKPEASEKESHSERPVSQQPVADSSQYPDGKPAKPPRKKFTFSETPPEIATRPVQPSIVQSLLKTGSTWLTTGNIPVKVGVIISFIGVAFLLKYAIDRKFIVLSLEMRLVGVALAGVAMLVIGWRLRHKARVYALSMQGGGVGILFLTVFAALRLWQLVPAGMAFILLCGLTLLTGALAVRQNARTLAILGIVGGFLAPVLTSTGQGSHVVLFSYYLVLNCAILGIAWFRAWRELNLVGFVFTFVIGSLWGYQYYKPELLTSTMPFLVLHFLFYQAIAILYALRQSPPKLGVVDGTLVFGTPVIAFSLQAALLKDTEYGLAISAAVVAVFYAVVTAWLVRRKQAELRLLIESFTALAVAFATLAIPLALDARWTSAAWALEGAALIWIGCRQGRHLANLAGASLILFSGLALLHYGWRSMEGPPMLNGNVIGCLLVSVSAFFASRKLEAAELVRFNPIYRVAATSLFVWALLWWLGMGWQEIDDRLATLHHAPVSLAFTSLSVLLGTQLARRWQWTLMHRASLLFLPFLGLMAMNYEARHQHFLLGGGWIAWPLGFLVLSWILRVLDETSDHVAITIKRAWHFLSLLLFTLLLALEAHWQTSEVISGAWAVTASSAVPGIVALLIWQFRFRPAWPVPAHPVTYRIAGLVLVSFQVLYLIYANIEQPGNPAPLPYVPLLNPFDFAMLFAALCCVLSVRVIKRDSTGGVFEFPLLRQYQLFLIAAFLVLTTIALVRGVHYYSGVPWDADRLYDSVIVQTALSVYWGLLGFIGMIWGARRSSRLMWLAGAGFMALVVAKLFLIDLGNSGTVERIISFIAIGALLLVVGYFAPAPASAEKQGE